MRQLQEQAKMYPNMNEDAMFERLETLRREIESSRLMAQGDTTASDVA
jgi:hypothetical protein